jgi:hypothetical protein
MWYYPHTQSISVYNKYVVNQNREHFDDISVSERLGRTSGFFVGFFLTKISLSLSKTMYLYLQRLLKKNEKKLARFFNFTFRYIEDILSLINSKFGDFVNRIYPIELEVKVTTDTTSSASYLDLHLNI